MADVYVVRDWELSFSSEEEDDDDDEDEEEELLLLLLLSSSLRPFLLEVGFFLGCGFFFPRRTILKSNVLLKL